MLITTLLFYNIVGLKSFGMAHRVLGFFSSRPNWDPPPPHPQPHRRRVCPLPLWAGGTPSLAGEGGPSSDDVTDTVAL